MIKLTGFVSDFRGNVLDDADVALKDINFEILYQTKTNNEGYYELEKTTDIE